MNTHSAHSQPGLIEKPLAEIQRLIDSLLPAATQVDTRKGGAINLVKQSKNNTEFFVILLISGEIELYRTASNNLLFATASGHNVFGLLGSSLRFNTYKFVPSKDSEIYILPREQAIDLIIKHTLIRELLTIHSFMSDIQAKGGNLLINSTAYEIVSTLLMELADVPEEKRLKISVANYIIDRSNLARSGVMKILSELRIGGYIDINYGKLICVNKRFPTVY
ncbi:helix-turn-helix domain-containing protein [Rahnella inusitata]|uniref:helix-turn-helix domain-containing protein n=1 Tax=Rahnella inusitata TaxID=58169 RepID=UPI0039BDE368